MRFTQKIFCILLACFALAPASRAQDDDDRPEKAVPGPRTITVRVIDADTGKPLSHAKIAIWVDPEMKLGHDTDDFKISPLHRHVLNAGDDGEALFNVPADVMMFNAHAATGPPIWNYLSCDAVKLKKTDKDPEYRFEDVFATGIAAPNFCNTRTATTKPKEFVFFVRSLSFKQGMHSKRPLKDGDL
jgi:hypothetical protein